VEGAKGVREALKPWAAVGGEGQREGREERRHQELPVDAVAPVMYPTARRLHRWEDRVPGAAAEVVQLHLRVDAMLLTLRRRS
jgi:hypothetical protein